MADLNFGRDVSTLGDLDGTFTWVTGKRVVLERIVRRWTTARGVLDYAPDEGLDLTAWVAEGATRAQRLVLANHLIAEAQKDDAVLSAAVSVSFDERAQSLSIVASIETEDRPFTFTLAVTDVSVSILRSQT